MKTNRKEGREEEHNELKPRKQRRENDNESKKALSDQRALGVMPSTRGPPPHAQPDAREHEVVDSWVVHRLRPPRGATPKTANFQDP